MEIRILTAADAQVYSDLRLEALATEPRAFSSSPADHLALSPEQIRERLQPADSDGYPDTFVFGAFDAGKLVGTAGFWRERQPKLRHKGTIWGVYVAPPHRGRGLSRSLMAAALDRLHGYPDLRQVNLAVTATQAPAERLYRSLGFEQFGYERGALSVAGEWVDEYWMVLRLKD
ncbi:MAG TPA: GNAT family protein [Bryobacteraceae bacterium]|nr:GNAT family protein [Bryobacteraceae bacterium]